MSKSEELKTQIAKLQSELKKAQKEEQELESGSPVAIATLMHSKLCHWNHVDGCSWEYESWETPGPPKLVGPSHKTLDKRQGKGYNGKGRSFGHWVALCVKNGEYRVGMNRSICQLM